MVENSQPLSDIRDETTRVAQAIDRSWVPLRLIGGAAIWLRSPSAKHELLQRSYADLDFVGLSSATKQIKRFLADLGYQADHFFNSLHGRTRLLFHDTVNNRQADVIFDEMIMCHHLNFRSRITVDSQTLPIADLLLTKLQIVQLNPKDLMDLITLLVDHPIGEKDGEMINARYIAELTAKDWGLYRTIQRNLERIREASIDLPEIGKYKVNEQVEALWRSIDMEPKWMKWKMRAAVGDRVKWYEIPEEVRRD